MAAAQKRYTVEVSDTSGAVILCLTYCNSKHLCHADLGLENSSSGWQQHTV